MVGKKKQALLFNPGTLVEYRLDPGTFHAQLATYGKKLFQDEDFADLYEKSGLGRPCVPPSQMAILMLLQYEAGVADGEAVERSGCDLRWAAAMDRMPGPPLCARTTLVLFRARLALHDAVERVFDKALEHARHLGILGAGKLTVLLDTRPIVGRGVVEDTYNLMARAMDRVMDQLAAIAGEAVSDWAAARQLSRYVRRRDSSLKGQMEIDWSDPQARRTALTEVVRDARRLLELGESALPGLKDETRKAVSEDLELLRQILAQDVEERVTAGDERPAEIKEGTAPDRLPSATDPDQRHGRKSASKKFAGHKARVAVDAESQLILDAEVLAGNAGDAEAALAQVERVEERTEQAVEATIGDCAFAGGATRQEFAKAGRTLHARQPLPAAPAFGISKSAFRILFDGEQATAVVCPAGNQVTERTQLKNGTQIFRFGSLCGRCPLRHKCVSAKRIRKGRSIQVHPQERLLHDAREFQNTEVGKQLLSERVVVEHALARMARLGIGQARYFGRSKTRFQVLMVAAVVNLRLTWNRKHSESASAGPDSGSSAPHAASAGRNSADRIAQRPKTATIAAATAALRGLQRLGTALGPLMALPEAVFRMGQAISTRGPRLGWGTLS